VVQVRGIAKSDLVDSLAVMTGLVPPNGLAAMRDEPRVALAAAQLRDQARDPVVPEDRIAAAHRGHSAMTAHSAVERGAGNVLRSEPIRSDLGQSGVVQRGSDRAIHDASGQEAQVDGRAERSLDRSDFVQNDLAVGSLGLSRQAQSGPDRSELDLAEPDQRVLNQSEVDRGDLGVESFADSATLTRTATTSTARSNHILLIDLNLGSAQRAARGQIEAESRGPLAASCAMAAGH